jgi:outer membrane protein OmpA-like peptidoglycan-associated protein
MSSRKDSFWIPYADLMTVLMLIFLFISVAFMGAIQADKKSDEDVVRKYVQTKTEIYNALDSTFKDKISQWNLELDEDLSIKFTNPDVLFESGSSTITTKFQLILREFIPMYLNVIRDPRYADKITEIRIEGHTDTVPTGYYEDPYMGNVKLSQERSRAVLEFIRAQPYYDTLNPEVKNRLQFWFTANGLSYGRTLDSNKELTKESGQAVNNQNSRRVEFRIVTSSEDILEEFLKRVDSAK